MNPSEWRQFLKRYSEEFLSHDWSDEIRLFSARGAVIPDIARRTGWMGYEPASEATIAVAEQRLGRRLPPSLRTFYEVSNGWGMIGSFIFNVLPVEKTGWLRDRDAHLYQMACENEAHDRPFKRDPDGSRHRQYALDEGTRVKRSLAISSWGDAAIWLLDPGERPHDAEWPAGRWSSWGPGMAWQAESFAELMKRELQALVAKREKPA
jgi:hypothetical protein